MTASEKRRRARRQCEAKQRFGRRTAERVAAQMNAGLADGQPVNAYRCPVCRSWHVGRARKHVWSIPPEGRPC